MDKKRIVKDYDKLPEEVLVRLKQKYPYGYVDNLVSFVNKEGNKVSALPFETEDIYYLIRMTISQANKIIEDDDDYDKEGNLKEEFSLDISDSELEDTDEKEDEEDEDEDNISVRLKNKRSSDDDFEENEPSESPDYF